MNWWTNQTYTGGSTQNFDVPLSQYPVFKRAGLYLKERGKRKDTYVYAGSIIPLKVTSDYSLHGDHTSSDALTVLLEHPASHQNDHVETRNVYEFQGSGLTLDYNFSKVDNSLVFRASAYSVPLIVLLRGIQPASDMALKLATKPVENLDNFDGISLLEISARDTTGCRLALRQASQGWCRGDGSLGEIWVRPGDSTLGIHLSISNIGGM